MLSGPEERQLISHCGPYILPLGVHNAPGFFTLSAVDILGPFFGVGLFCVQCRVFSSPEAAKTVSGCDN